MTTLFRKSSVAKFWLTSLFVALLAGGCDSLQEKPATPTSPASTGAVQPPSSPPPAAPPPVQAYDKAVLSAATALFKNAKLPPEGTAAQAKYTVVIDPLIDGMTGAQSVATRSMGVRLATMMREQYPQYDVKAFSAANVAKSPLVLIGTFTGVNAERKTAGPREAYRICLALADLRSGKLVSKGLAFALPDGVDPTPLPFFRDAPAWSEDPATEGYIKTCQGTKAGDPINPLYLDRIIAGRRSHRCLRCRPLPGRARSLYQRLVHAGGKSVPRPERPLPRQLETGPPATGGSGIRQDRRLWP